MIGAMAYEFDAQLWHWNPGEAGTWTALSLPADVADEVLEIGAPYARGFGSLRVEATVGGTTWRTSIFPDDARRTYALPVNKAVRRAEGVEAGDLARVRLRLLDVGAAEADEAAAGRPGGRTA